jgi:hypothetical protein
MLGATGILQADDVCVLRKQPRKAAHIGRSL